VKDGCGVVWWVSVCSLHNKEGIYQKRYISKTVYIAPCHPPPPAGYLPTAMLFLQAGNFKKTIPFLGVFGILSTTPRPSAVAFMHHLHILPEYTISPAYLALSSPRGDPERSCGLDPSTVSNPSKVPSLYPFSYPQTTTFPPPNPYALVYI
jgi:hypothetical protein